MKLLLLNFLFFVGSAIVFIQCAKMFPTTDKSSKHQPAGQTIINRANVNKPNDAALGINNTSTFKFNIKNRVITPFFNNSGFPYNMMAYFNYHSLFYNPYISFNYYGFARKHRGKPQHDK